MPPAITGQLGQLYIECDGKRVPFASVGITSIKEALPPNPRYAPPISVEDMEMTLTATLQTQYVTKYKKGFFHTLAGIDSGAARRYIRSVKRQKEKERRRRLKHETGVCRNVR